jgi:antitoxin HigA-1
MTDELHEFTPDWTIRPGVLLRQELAARGATPDELAASVGLAAEVITEVIDGTRKINQMIAERLYAALGISASFWFNFQAKYDADIARGAKDTSGDYREDGLMGEMDAARRAAGYEVEARVMLTHGADALLELPGEREPVRWPAAEVAAGAGVTVEQLPGMRVRVTVRESPDAGRVLSEWRPAG